MKSLDTEEEIYKYFTKLVQRNLHVVFTMNPATQDYTSRAATSPALFNRCVVNWFGSWSQHALAQVGYEFTTRVDMEDTGRYNLAAPFLCFSVLFCSFSCAFPVLFCAFFLCVCVCVCFFCFFQNHFFFSKIYFIVIYIKFVFNIRISCSPQC